MHIPVHAYIHMHTTCDCHLFGTGPSWRLTSPSVTCSSLKSFCRQIVFSFHRCEPLLRNLARLACLAIPDCWHAVTELLACLHVSTHARSCTHAHCYTHEQTWEAHACTVVSGSETQTYPSSSRGPRVKDIDKDEILWIMSSGTCEKTQSLCMLSSTLG
jgi:hypothetical protein